MTIFETKNQNKILQINPNFKSECLYWNNLPFYEKIENAKKDRYFLYLWKWSAKKLKELKRETNNYDLYNLIDNVLWEKYRIEPAATKSTWSEFK